MKHPLALLLSGLAGCASSPAGPALDEARLELAGPCVVALEPDARPVARVGLGVGEARRFLLDSGSSLSLIDGRCVAELGLERRAYPSSFEIVGSGGRTARIDEYVLLERLELGALGVHPARVSVMDDPALALAGVDGVLGQDLLARLVLLIDMQHDVLHVLPGAGTQPIEAYLETLGHGRGAWDKTALEFRPCPFFTVEFAESAQPFELELDTGAVSTSLPAAVLVALGLEPTGVRLFAGVGGNHTEELYPLEGFGLLGRKASLQVTAAATDHGLLGMDVLGETAIVLDGPGRMLWLQRTE